MDWTYLFFSFDGRISRKPYWIATCVLIAAAFIAIWIELYAADRRLGAILNLALLYPDLAVMVKRAHDRETPIWIVLASAIMAVLLDALEIFGLGGTVDTPSTLYWLISLPMLPVIGYLFVVLGFFQGTRGPNRYGPDPLAART